MSVTFDVEPFAGNVGGVSACVLKGILCLIVE